MINWLIAIFLLPLLALLKDYYDEWRYDRKSAQSGCGVPLKRLNRPFGLTKTLAIYRAVRNFELDKSSVKNFHDPGAHTIRGSGLFSKVIFTIDPENIKTILSTNFKDYSMGKRYEGLHPLLGDGIFTLSRERWKHARAMLRPQFNRDQVSQLDSLKKHSQEFVDLCKRYASEKEVFDIQPSCYELTLDTATEFLFGKSVNSLGKPNQEFSRSFNFCLDYMCLRLQLDKYCFLANSKEFQKHIKVCHDFVDQFVQMALNLTDHEKSHPGRFVFIEELTKEIRDPVAIRDQAFNILLAGRDTTASLLNFCIYRLGTDRRVFNKLRQAVLDEFGTGTDKITFESLKRCQYLHNFMNEVLRLNPVVPFNARYADKDTILPRGGRPDESQPILVPKGTKVNYTIHVMQRNERYWGDTATKFYPERWDDQIPHTWDYLPFNGGPRMCLGQQFARTEIAYTIVRLLQNFREIQYYEKGPDPFADAPRIWLKLTASFADGCNISLTPA
jgi:cytochrome P450